MKAGLQCVTDGIPIILLYVFFLQIYMSQITLFEESWGTHKQLHWEAAWTLKADSQKRKKNPFLHAGVESALPVAVCQTQYSTKLSYSTALSLSLPRPPNPPPPFVFFLFFLFFFLKTDLVLLHLHIYGCENKVAEQSSELLKKPFILHS